MTRKRVGMIAAPLLLLTLAGILFGHASAPARSAAKGTELLPKSKVILRSAGTVNLTDDTVRLPLHKGVFHGQTVWYVITESSDFGLAHDLNVNFAPKLANIGIACPKCVQAVTLKAPGKNTFGEAVVNFKGVPNFKPKRVLAPGPPGAPPVKMQPGSVAGPGYSPFIRIKGSNVVYNAPIVATGTGHFDVVHHTNTLDRVLAIRPAASTRGGQFTHPSVDLLFVRGFDAGQTIFYLSTESSDKLGATLERATFTPLLKQSSFVGGDDFLGSARERIFIFLNGQTGSKNPQAQGIAHLIADGHASEDASLKNRPLLDALSNDGDLLNVLGDFPSLNDPRHANAYSPLWDAQVGQWSKKAVAGGLNRRQNDENEVINLAATRPDLITGPKGVPYGSVGFVINCPIIAFTKDKPTKDLAALVPKAQG